MYKNAHRCNMQMVQQFTNFVSLKICHQFLFNSFQILPISKYSEFYFISIIIFKLSFGKGAIKRFKLPFYKIKNTRPHTILVHNPNIKRNKENFISSLKKYQQFIQLIIGFIIISMHKTLSENFLVYDKGPFKQYVSIYFCLFQAHPPTSA